MRYVVEIRNLLFLLMACLIPFNPRFLSIIIAVSALLWIISPGLKEGLASLKRQPGMILLLLFYAFHGLALLWSNNLDYGTFDMQVKLSMLIFPLIMGPSRVPPGFSLQNVYRAFITGNTIALMVCLFRAIACYFIDGSNYFFYKDFSIFVHPGYFSMYLCFSIAILLFMVLRSREVPPFFSKALCWLLIILQCMGVVLLASKAGILILILVLIIAGLIVIFQHGGALQLIPVIVLSSLFVYFGLFSTLTSGRMNELKSTLGKNDHDTVVHTSAMRLQAWQSAWQIIQENPLEGTGTGDIKDRLVQVYDQHGFREIARLRLNAHNQFLQTMAALGVAGLTVFLALLTAGLVYALRNRNFIFISFIFIFVLNSMVESIIEVSAGVIFFAYFYTLFYNYDNRTYSGN